MTAWVGSPLPYPFFAIVNTTIGVVIFFLFAGLGVKYTGAWYSDYLPISSASVPFITYTYAEDLI
jgi:hypothetical protein